MTKQKIFYLSVSVLLFLAVGTILALLINGRNESSFTGTVPSPTPLPESRQAVTRPLLQYAPDSGEKIVKKTENRQPLDPADAAVRKSITDRLQARSGVVYLANNIRIDYIASADVFQGEIRTTDLAAAKNEAVTWFRGQGMSDGGICNLPLIFYVYPPVAAALRSQNIVFDPLPEGC